MEYISWCNIANMINFEISTNFTMKFEESSLHVFIIISTHVWYICKGCMEYISWCNIANMINFEISTNFTMKFEESSLHVFIIIPGGHGGVVVMLGAKYRFARSRDFTCAISPSKAQAISRWSCSNSQWFLSQNLDVIGCIYVLCWSMISWFLQHTLLWHLSEYKTDLT